MRVTHTRAELEAAVATACARYGIDSHIGYCQITVESAWNERAVNKASGAQGLAQFMPATARDLGLSDPFNGIASADAYGRYMHQLLKMFRNDIVKALAAYNWGMGNVGRAVTKYGADWLRHAPEETRQYVTKIMRRAKAMYAKESARAVQPKPKIKRPA